MTHNGTKFSQKHSGITNRTFLRNIATNRKKITKQITENDPEYFQNLDEFLKIYNTPIVCPKVDHRYFCFRNMNKLRNIYDKQQINIPKVSKFEAVIVEFRKFPHVEFVIRNTILKLKDKWSYSVVCGNLNFDFIKTMCDTISLNINIIQLPFDNIDQSSYSQLLGSVDFWNMLSGDKILIYQEDSCIFKSNIEDFLEFDYIGAPFAVCFDLPYGGNGGLSLRSRQSMIDVINTENIASVRDPAQPVKTYMEMTGMTCIPEDIYFCTTMKKYNIGKLSDVSVGKLFSTECIFSQNSFGGHAFWKSMGNWKHKISASCLMSP